MTLRRPAVAAGALLAATLLAGCGSTGTAHAPPPPLAGSSGSATAVATVPMGDTSSAQDTFWELFARRGPRWVLLTPPGVATNGGLAAAVGPTGAVVAGVLPSAELRFSTIAETTDLGAAWTTGVLPTGLVRAPDAVAGGPRGSRVALLSGDGGSVAVSHGGLSAWRVLASAADVARETPGCDLGSLRAVAVAADGTALVAGRCAHGSRLPVALLRGGRWHLVPSGADVGTGATVLRLATSPAGASALVETGGGSRRLLVAQAARGPRSAWSASPAIAIGGDDLVSTWLVPDARAAAVVVRPGRPRTLLVTTAHGGWAQRGALPAGTVDVVATSTGGYQALSVDGATLRVFDDLGRRWQLVQRLVVPIQLGSSH